MCAALQDILHFRSASSRLFAVHFTRHFCVLRKTGVRHFAATPLLMFSLSFVTAKMSFSYAFGFPRKRCAEQCAVRHCHIDALHFRLMRAKV